MNKSVFIACSNEELPLARKVKELIEPEMQVTIWDEWDTKTLGRRLNQHVLEVLHRQSLLFDYGIIIGTKDDLVYSRGAIEVQPRDNVLFELGLFIGRMGLSKCAFLVEEEVKIPSDWDGINLVYFDRNKPQSLEEAVSRITDNFMAINRAAVDFLPSFTLAATYFENLINPTCSYLIQNNGYELDGKKLEHYEIDIIIPKKISSDVNLQFERLKATYNLQHERFQYAGRPRNINIDVQPSANSLKIIDFPTIIAGINYAIQNLLPQEFTDQDELYNKIVNKELDRFEEQLNLYIKREYFDSFTRIVHV